MIIHGLTEWYKFFYHHKFSEQHQRYTFAVLQEIVIGVGISWAFSHLPYKYTRETESTNIQELLTWVLWVLASTESFVLTMSFHFEY